MITTLISILHDGDYYGAGKYTEIAKGKYQKVDDWHRQKKKIKRALRYGRHRSKR